MGFVTATQLDQILRQIEALYDLASRVQATMIMMFLQGLRSFLMVAAYEKDSTLRAATGKRRDEDSCIDSDGGAVGQHRARRAIGYP